MKISKTRSRSLICPSLGLGPIDSSLALPTNVEWLCMFANVPFAMRVPIYHLFSHGIDAIARVFLADFSRVDFFISASRFLFSIANCCGVNTNSFSSFSSSSSSPVETTSFLFGVWGIPGGRVGTLFFFVLRLPFPIGTLATAFAGLASVR